MIIYFDESWKGKSLWSSFTERFDKLTEYEVIKLLSKEDEEYNFHNPNGFKFNISKEFEDRIIKLHAEEFI